MRIRLTRPLTAYEAEGLAMIEPGLRRRGRCDRRAERTLDDVARAHDTWAARLERVQTRAGELEGASLVADHRRIDAQNRHGSHLLSQSADDRGMH